MAELVCVPPDRITEFWPLASHLIRSAMERGGLGDFESVEQSTLAGGALLWLAWDGKTILSAAVTELTKLNGHLFCTIVGCAGEQRDDWLPLIAGLETYARNEGCKAMRIWGRKGWARVLPGYAVARVQLEKELN